jgi:hypothetical protein
MLCRGVRRRELWKHGYQADGRIEHGAAIGSRPLVKVMSRRQSAACSASRESRSRSTHRLPHLFRSSSPPTRRQVIERWGGAAVSHGDGGQVTAKLRRALDLGGTRPRHSFRCAPRPRARPALLPRQHAQQVTPLAERQLPASYFSLADAGGGFRYLLPADTLAPAGRTRSGRRASVRCPAIPVGGPGIHRLAGNETVSPTQMRDYMAAGTASCSLIR